MNLSRKVAGLTVGLLMIVAAPALAAPPTYVPAIGDAFVCHDATYTVTSGGVLVREEHRAAAGASHVVFHLTAKGLEATDGTTDGYRIVGTATDVVHYDGAGAITTEHFTVRMRILSPDGGVAGIAHLTFHVHRDGELRMRAAGTCTPPNSV